MMTTDAVGGVWNYSMSLAQGLVRLGCRCTVVVLGPSPNVAQLRCAADAGVHLIDSGLELDWTAQGPTDLGNTAEALARLGERLHATLAHVHTPAFVTAGWTIPVVAVVHSCVATWWAAVQGGAMPMHLTWRAEALLAGLEAADAVVAPSAAFAWAVRSTYGFSGEMSVIHNGMQQSLASKPTRDRVQFVLSACRLWDEGKNMATLDEAARVLPYPVVAAGSVLGPDGARFRACAMSTPGVLSAGKLEEAYRQAAIFASPSLYEPFGLAVLEAASAGVPLVLSDIPTFRELWSDAAVFVPPRDPRAWAEAIANLMEDQAARAHLGNAARARSKCYGQQRMVDRTRAVHGALLGATMAAA